MNDVKFNDFSNICRCCLRGGSITLNHMFLPPTDPLHCVDDVKGYAQMFTICTDLEIKQEDDFPHLICKQCASQMWGSYCFRRKCQESAYTLSQIKTKHFSMGNDLCGSPEFIGCCNDNTNFDVSENIDEPQPYNILEPKVSSHEDQLIDEELVEEFKDDDFHDTVSESDEIEPQRPVRTKNKIKSIKVKDEDDLSIVELRKAIKRKVNKAPKTASVVDSKLRSVKKYQKKKKYERKKAEQQICPICGVIRYNLGQHMATHSEGPKCKCEECGIFVKTPGTLRKHMLRVHSEHRPYKCDVCNMALKTSTHLKRHMLTHTRERNFSCTYCGKTFIDAGTRDGHQWRHNAERKIKCQHCDKLFLTPKGLLNHVGLHTGELPFKCGLCPKAFVNSQAASIHRRSHTIDNYYPCGTCDMRFKVITLLKIHIKVEKHSLCFSQE